MAPNNILETIKSAMTSGSVVEFYDEDSKEFVRIPVDKLTFIRRENPENGKSYFTLDNKSYTKIVAHLGIQGISSRKQKTDQSNSEDGLDL